MHHLTLPSLLSIVYYYPISPPNTLPPCTLPRHQQQVPQQLSIVVRSIGQLWHRQPRHDKKVHWGERLEGVERNAFWVFVNNVGWLLFVDDWGVDRISYADGVFLLRFFFKAILLDLEEIYISQNCYYMVTILLYCTTNKLLLKATLKFILDSERFS